MWGMLVGVECREDAGCVVVCAAKNLSMALPELRLLKGRSIPLEVYVEMAHLEKEETCYAIYKIFTIYYLVFFLTSK